MADWGNFAVGFGTGYLQGSEQKRRRRDEEKEKAEREYQTFASLGKAEYRNMRDSGYLKPVHTRVNQFAKKYGWPELPEPNLEYSPEETLTTIIPGLLSAQKQLGATNLPESGIRPFAEAYARHPALGGLFPKAQPSYTDALMGGVFSPQTGQVAPQQPEPGVDVDAVTRFLSAKDLTDVTSQQRLEAQKGRDEVTQGLRLRNANFREDQARETRAEQALDNKLNFLKTLITGRAQLGGQLPPDLEYEYQRLMRDPDVLRGLSPAQSTAVTAAPGSPLTSDRVSQTMGVEPKVATALLTGEPSPNVIVPSTPGSTVGMSPMGVNVPGTQPSKPWVSPKEQTRRAERQQDIAYRKKRDEMEDWFRKQSLARQNAYLAIAEQRAGETTRGGKKGISNELRLKVEERLGEAKRDLAAGYRVHPKYGDHMKIDPAEMSRLRRMVGVYQGMLGVSKPAAKPVVKPTGKRFATQRPVREIKTQVFAHPGWSRTKHLQELARRHPGWDAATAEAEIDRQMRSR